MLSIKHFKEGILTHEAVRIDAAPSGERFRVEIPVVGPAGSAIVRTLWIVRTGVPRLTSAYPIR